MTTYNDELIEKKINAIIGLIDRKRESFKKERQEAREAKGITEPLKGDLAHREEAEVLDLTMLDYEKQSSNLGMTMLAILWQMTSNNLNAWLSEGDQRALVYVASRKDLWRDYYYVRALAKVVDTIFPYVHERVVKEEPIRDEEETPITVERLIATDGLIAKLKENADHFSLLEKDEQRIALLRAIVRPGSKALAALKKKQTIAVDPDQVVVATRQYTDGGMVKLVILATETQADAIMRLTGGMLVVKDEFLPEEN